MPSDVIKWTALCLCCTQLEFTFSQLTGRVTILVSGFQRRYKWQCPVVLSNEAYYLCSSTSESKNNANFPAQCKCTLTQTLLKSLYSSLISLINVHLRFSSNHTVQTFGYFDWNTIVHCLIIQICQTLDLQLYC